MLLGLWLLTGMGRPWIGGPGLRSPRGSWPGPFNAGRGVHCCTAGQRRPVKLQPKELGGLGMTGAEILEMHGAERV